MVDEIWVASNFLQDLAGTFFKICFVADSRAALVRIPYGNVAKADTFVDAKFINF